ncbi:MAG: zinc-ribbon domain-containing protein, partial [Polyangiales bacterium]
MIKVECVSCKAPYELDPRRIPDKGMKMRCPKCGASFIVSKEGVASGLSAVPAPPPLGAPPPAIGAPPSAAASPLGKGTLIGQTAADVSVMPAVPKHKTSVGVAPAAPSPQTQERSPAGSLVPPPATGPGVPFKAQVAPQPAPPIPSSGNRAAAAKGAFGATMVGTPAVQPKPAPPAPPPELDLPVASADDELPSQDVELPDDLPALKAPSDPQDLSVSRIFVDELPTPKGEVDLPAPRAPAAPKARVEFDVDLPAPRAPAAPKARVELDVDLPAPRAPAAAKPEVDLPAAKGGADLPVPRPFAAPPRVATKAKIGGGGFGDLDLPGAPGFADLPAPRVADLPGPRGVTDLPGPRGVTDLPAARVADLPGPRGVTDLPAARVADLPGPTNVTDLPSRKGGGGMSFGDLDLPVPRADGGFGTADLPAPQGDLLAPKSDESSFADLDLGLPDLPPASGGAAKAKDAFGDIELPPPKPAANLVPPKAKTVQGMGGRTAQAKQDDASFGDVKLGDHDSDLPPSLMGDDESSFDDLNLEPEASAPPPPRAAPPSARARRASGPADTVEELEPDAMDLDEHEKFDDHDEAFGEEEFQEGEEGATDGDEEMEFGISGEEGKDMGLPPDLLRKQRGEEFEAKQAQRGKRTVTIVVRLAILLVLLGAGGAALTFTRYGAFGIFYWERFLPEAGDPRFARDAIEKAEKIAASDTYGDVRRSLKELGEARAKAGLNRELLTRSLLHHALFVVRFGEDANVAAHAAAIMKRLEERSWQAPGMDLARAADAARRKQWAEVEGPLGAARSQAGSDAYVELVAGEAALAQGKLDAADKAFAKALQLGGGARAQWGIARVALQRNDVEAQSTAINDTLKLSPLHVDARMAEARVLWMQGKEERAQHLLRVALGLDPTEEDQYLSSSKLAASEGYALLGYMHETRGRLHMAREAYEQSLAADPYRVDALLGSGRVLLRDKRYADAQA